MAYTPFSFVSSLYTRTITLYQPKFCTIFVFFLKFPNNPYFKLKIQDYPRNGAEKSRQKNGLQEVPTLSPVAAVLHVKLRKIPKPQNPEIAEPAGEAAENVGRDYLRVFYPKIVARRQRFNDVRRRQVLAFQEPKTPP